MRPAPIAIVGMACRGPGHASTDELWTQLSRGQGSNARLPAMGQLDEAFFRLSPRESERMDPCQRLMLELSWEAMEDAQIPPDSLAGTSVGVYLGSSTHGLAPTLFDSAFSVPPSPYDVTGTLPGLLAGRISYVLGLRGPSLCLDTTCSSSLVAIHLAYRALQQGECDLALAGGVNFVPHTDRERRSWEQLMPLSSRGRCASFDASADGVVGGDGGGVLVLARLDDARAVRSVLLGSAVNHDGRSPGLTVPSGAAQRELLRAALADAGLAPDAVDHLECHATGTLLGDPIEVHALAEVLAEQRTRPLWLGALKSNLGHLGAAAGVMGVIKTILALQHELLPKTLHFTTPSPQIAWSRWPALQVVAESTAWPRGERPRIAGISAFGLSGTNAHVLLGEPPLRPPRKSAPEREAEPILLSARSPAALQEGAARLQAQLASAPELSLADLACSLATTRTHHDLRVGLAVSSKDALKGALEAVSSGKLPASTPSESPRVAWLLPGQGAQLVGMGSGLARAFPVFRHALDEVAQALEPYLPLAQVLATSDPIELARTELTQPALFALSVALGALWRSFGLEPAILLGHSIGELAAVHLAGGLSLEDAARLVAVRARCMASMPPGQMFAVRASEERVRRAVDELGVDVSLAAINAAEAVVLSGSPGPISQVVEHLGVRGTPLAVSRAFHSSHVDAVCAELAEHARLLVHHPPRVPVVSNVTGGVVELRDPEYWVRHARAPVRFADGVRAVRALGVTHFLELGPRPVLLPLVAEPGRAEALVPSLRPGRSEPEALLEAVCRLHVDGVPLDHAALCAPGAQPVRLPTYAWQRRSSPLPRAPQPTTFTSTLPRWVEEHRVWGEAWLPATALLEMMRAAGQRALERPVSVEEVTLTAPLSLPTGEVQIQVEGSLVTVRARRGEAPWTTHATGRLAPGEPPPRSPVDLDTLRRGEPIDVAAAYARAERIGLAYGPVFRGVQRAWQGDGEVTAELVLPPVDDAGSYELHPALLDSALHAGVLASAADELQVPFAVERFTVRATPPPGPVLARVRAEEVLLFGATGQLLAEIVGVRTRPAAREPIWQLQWVPADRPVPQPLSGRWLVVGSGESPLTGALVQRLRAGGTPCERLAPDSLASAGPCEGLLIVFGEPDPLAGLALARTVVEMAPPRAVFVTHHAAHPALDPRATALWGLLRSAAAEGTATQVRLVDLEGADLESLYAELSAREPQVALREEGRFVARLQPAPLLPRENYELTPDLRWSPRVRTTPGPGQVEIEVRATGLNFRDVLVELGLYPGGGGPLGHECSGQVVRVGPGVTRCAMGDPVMAFGSSMFSRYTTVDQRQVVRKPPALSWEEAAGVPLVFLTAWYALCDLARLRPGERVLVHAAAGGVGMAAVQLAHRLGATVLATASPSKWDALRALGVTELASSREPAFAEQFGRTADVVLGALAGPLVDAGLSTLRPGGRYLEMGKTDVRDPGAVEAEHGVRYQAFDLTEASLDRIASMLDTIARALQAGELRPLPITRFELAEVPAAFQFLRQARHIGKVVVSSPRAWRLDGTALVLGGLGVLGLHVARWLVGLGVRHLVLLGRRGSETPGADAAVAELESRGASVWVEAVDGSDVRALAAAMGRIDPAAPLRIVIHAAGVLEDAPLHAVTPDQFSRVWRAKATVADNLDELTRGADLDAFVLFSSVAGTLGSAGQAAYAAANAYLDGLAWRRRAQGLPAHSVAFGPWAGEGMASTLGPVHRARLARLGVEPLAPERALASLGRVLGRSEPVAVVAALERTVAAPETPQTTTPPDLVQLVRAEVARVLALDGVPPDKAFSELGLDSLMAVELRNRLVRRLGVPLHASVAFDYPTAQALGTWLAQSVPRAGVPAPPADRVADLLARIAALSEQEQQALADALFGREAR
jgi:acyl transferase domain-containing protein